MAQVSLPWDTNGTGDGAAEYTEEQVVTWQRQAFNRNPIEQGILPMGANFEYDPSASGANVTIKPGAANVYGWWCWSTANEIFAIPVPTLGNTGHRIVLRADWATQQVRLALVSSSNGVAAIPALTQIAGTRWEISVCTVIITTSGQASVSDTRKYLHHNVAVAGEQLDAPLHLKKQNTLGEGAEIYLEGSDGNPGWTLDVYNGIARFLQDSVGGFSFDGDGSFAGILGAFLPLLTRQGGHATDWGVHGTNNYPVDLATRPRIMVGLKEWTIPDGTGAGQTTVNFGSAFGKNPLVGVFPYILGATANHIVNVDYSSVTTASFAFNHFRGSNNPGGLARGYVFWFAIGQMA